MHEPFIGLVPAMLTPFSAAGELNLKPVEQQVELLIRDGVAAVFVCGTTGEFSSLTLDERLALASRSAEVLKGSKVRLIVHVGSNCIAESRQLAAHAASIGAAAIAMLSPSYFKPRSADVLIECCADVARSAPGTPFYFYDIPVLTGVTFPVADWVERASERIPSFAGVKFTNPDLLTYQRLLRAMDGRLDVLFGMDEQLLAALSLGGRGAVGSGYNFAAPLFHRLLAATAQGALECARDEQFRAARLIATMFRLGYLSAAKEFMRLRGVDLGPVRLPQSNLSNEQVAELLEEVDRIGGRARLWG